MPDKLSQTAKCPALVRNALLLALLAGASFAQAQLGDLRLPISLDADSTDYDGKSSMLMFEGLRLSQGNIGVQADRGLASKLDFEDSVWQFTGNVVIDTENGRIECDTADLMFSEHKLQRATISGTPATFELLRQDSEDVTYAEAGKLDYDFAKGVIEFSEDAVISEGGNQISSNYLVYNISEQRINAQSAGDGEPRVKITYTPQEDDATQTAPEDESPPTPEAADESDEEDSGEGSSAAQPEQESGAGSG